MKLDQYDEAVNLLARFAKQNLTAVSEAAQIRRVQQ